ETERSPWLCTEAAVRTGTRLLLAAKLRRDIPHPRPPRRGRSYRARRCRGGVTAKGLPHNRQGPTEPRRVHPRAAYRRASAVAAGAGGSASLCRASTARRG